MSLQTVDMDGDGDDDVVISDRKGGRKGVYWLEQPSSDQFAVGAAWQRHPIYSGELEVMFLHAKPDCRFGRHTWRCHAGDAKNGSRLWAKRDVSNPAGIVAGKAVRWLDQDRSEFVFTSNTGVHRQDRSKSGVWVASSGGEHPPIDVSGPRGVKFDRIEVRDLDGDGDLDILTCEERHNLGVFWYENPEH